VCGKKGMDSAWLELQGRGRLQQARGANSHVEQPGFVRAPGAAWTGCKARLHT
jgi:hypothetical protein